MIRYKKIKNKTYKNNEITVKPVKDEEDIYDVYKDYRYLGYLDKTDGGAFVTKRQNLFRKFNGFGINMSLLESDIEFETIVIEYNNKFYVVSRKLLLDAGEKFTFKDGDTKLFLPISAFTIEDNESPEEVAA